MIFSMLSEIAIALTLGTALPCLPAACQKPAAKRTWIRGSWISVRTIGEGHDLLLAPSSFGTDDSALYVFDFGDHALKAFLRTGEPRWKIGAEGAPAGDFQNPTDVEVAPDGKVWVADPVAGRVSVFTPTGHLARRFERMQNVTRVLPNGDGTFWAWAAMETTPELRNADGNRLSWMTVPAVLDGVSGPAAEGWLARMDDQSTVVGFNFANYFLVARGRGKRVNSFAGVGAPRAFPKLVPDTITIGGKPQPGLHFPTGTRVVCAFASVSGDTLFILRADDEPGSPMHLKTVDSYRVPDGMYLGSYLLPNTVRTLRVQGGEFIGVSVRPSPSIHVWRFSRAN